MRILYITTIGITMNFFKTLISDLIKDGHTVDIACNEDIEPIDRCFDKMGCKKYNLSCTRFPFDKGNIKAVKEINKIVINGEYDIVHCHTPIAAACTRLACRKLRKNNVRVIYTAHGFHFYKGAPLKNWLIFYPVEKLCARFTDVLITINNEDYERAKKKLKVEKVEYVPGVGIDVDKFKNTMVDKVAKRQEIGVPEDAFLLASVGELNANKNHEVIIRAMAEISDKSLHYVIAGVGELENHLNSLANKLGIVEQVHLLGYRNDIAEINKATDLFCFPSYREGLPVALLEAMASGLPVVVANNRGTKDCVNRENNIIIPKPKDIEKYKQAILIFLNNEELRIKAQNHNIEEMEKYDVQMIIKEIKRIYY